MATLISSIQYPGATTEYTFRAQKLPATQVGGTSIPVYITSDGVPSAITSVSSSLLPSIPFSKLPSLYWANVAVSSASATNTQPVVNTVTVQNDTNNKCKIQYDSTESCVKFVF